MSTVEERCRAAKRAQPALAAASTGTKNNVLRHVAELLEARSETLVEANRIDVEAARDQKLSAAMIDRLRLTEARVADIATGVRQIATLPDPVGEISNMRRRPNGLLVGRMRIPLGVVAMIFESRPNVVIDAGALCLKSGNAVILKGGREAEQSNRLLADVLTDALSANGLDGRAVQLLTDRGEVAQLLQQDATVDLVIPRGGEGLIRYVTENSRIPVVQHYKGVCHVFADTGCDLNMARDIIVNAKAQRPGVCNAAETLLVHADIAPRFLLSAAEALAAAGVTLRGCAKSRAIVPSMEVATEEDWHAEYLAKILAVKVVRHLDEALEHIARYGSDHTETIVTNDYRRANRFVMEVPSSAVMVNASTRFNDGGQLGLGAEIGISTSRLHAFGPMGLEELTTTKFVVYGDGHVRP